MGQGFEEHLTKTAEDFPEDSQSNWKMIDAQLCAVLWQPVNPKLLVIFQAYNTSYTFWEDVKKLYTNLKQDSNLFSYLSIAKATIEKYKNIMPIIADAKEQEKKRDKFCMVLVLASLHFDLMLSVNKYWQC